MNLAGGGDRGRKNKMTTTASSLRLGIVGLAAVWACALPQAASAGFLRINFAQAFDFGEDWTGAFDDDLNISAGEVFTSDLAPGGQPFSLGSAGGPSFAGTANPNPFADGLNVGGTTYTSFCFSKNGAVGLGTSSGCSLDPTVSPLFSVLGGDWNYFPSSGAPTPSSISVALGLVDRDFGVDGTYDAATAVPALRIFWNGVVDGPQPPDDTPPLGGLEFQAIFFDLGGGDFDVEFNYRELYDTGIQRISTPDGLGGFNSLFFGVDADRLSGLRTEPYFQFRDGVFSLSSTQPPDPDPTEVPEPGTLWLLAAGAALLLLSRRGVARRAR
jgi:hypothetical protein